jgi:O-acetyl-ADP-ribose deacetylase
VSAGIYGWPLEDAARIAVQTVATARTRVQEAIFVLFGRETFSVFGATAKDLQIET